MIFYTLALLVFSFRIAQYSIEISPRSEGQNSKLAYILGTSTVIFELDIGVAMIMLIRQMQAMLQSVIVFQKPDPHYKRKIAVVALITTVLEIPIVVSWFMYSEKAVLFVNDYLPCLFGLLVIGLSYFTLQVVLQMRKLPRIINNSKEL